MSESTRAPEPRARLRLANVRQAFAATPWAILPAKLDAMLAVVETHAAGGTLPKVENTFAARREAASGRRGTNGGVAVLPIYGVLTQRAGLMTDYSGGTSTEALTQAFDAMAADPNVGTIVLDIDSPGGSVAGIPELGAKIAAARESKKVIAVANTLCASAAYWLASQAHEIVASPSAMVGSIGVYAVHTDTSAADAQAGVSHTVIRFGAHKADGLVGPLSEDGIAEMQAIVDEHGKAFVAAVAKGRGITPAQVRADYGDGAIFAAKGAKAAGLVDRIASLEDVLGSLGATVRRREATYGANAEAAPVDLAAAIETELAAQLAQPDALRAAVIAALAPSADACVGALGDAPTTHTEPAPQARSHTVSDQNTAVQSGAAPTMAELLAADRKRVADVLAMATEYNVPAATANQWAADGLTVNEVAAKILEQRRTQSAAQPQITMGADRAAEKPFESLAHQLQAVMRAGRNPAQTDVRLLHINAAAQGTSTGSSSEAGFVIQPDFAPGIESKMWDQGQILSRVTDTQISGNSFKENQLKEDSRAAGSRNGGMQHYWVGEAGAVTASKPTLRQIETPLNKIVAAWYATEETLEDAPAIASEVDRLVPMELTFGLEDKIVNGSGAGVPTGIMVDGGLVTVALEPTQTLANSAQFYPNNLTKMWARLPAASKRNAAWFVNPEVMPFLQTMTLGAGSAAIPVWLPSNSIDGPPSGTIIGRPVIEIEFAAAHGTPGDILLADLSDYRLVRKGGVNRSASIHVQFLTDESVFKWTYRVGGQPRTKVPVTPYKGTATLSPYVVLAARS